MVVFYSSSNSPTKQNGCRRGNGKDKPHVAANVNTFPLKVFPGGFHARTVNNKLTYNKNKKKPTEANKEKRYRKMTTERRIFENEIFPMCIHIFGDRQACFIVFFPKS